MRHQVGMGWRLLDIIHRGLAQASMRWRCRLRVMRAAWAAERELRAMDVRELHDLGLDRGGIAYAARQGRRG